jgi:hypothetical protein
MRHLLSHLTFVALLATPALAEPVATVARTEGPERIEEIRIYVLEGPHLTGRIAVLPVTVRARISGGTLPAAEERKLIDAAVTCRTGHVRDLSETRDGAGTGAETWTFTFECVTPRGKG